MLAFTNEQLRQIEAVVEEIATNWEAAGHDEEQDLEFYDYLHDPNGWFEQNLRDELENQLAADLPEGFTDRMCVEALRRLREKFPRQ